MVDGGPKSADDAAKVIRIDVDSFHFSAVVDNCRSVEHNFLLFDKLVLSSVETLS